MPGRERSKGDIINVEPAEGAAESFKYSTGGPGQRMEADADIILLIEYMTLGFSTRRCSRPCFPPLPLSSPRPFTWDQRAPRTPSISNRTTRHRRTNPTTPSRLQSSPQSSLSRLRSLEKRRSTRYLLRFT